MAWFIFILLSLSFSLSTITASNNPQALLTLDTTTPLFTFDSSFISINIDTASLDANIDLTDAVLINIIKQLGDVWVRVGGTSSNDLIYEPNGQAGDVEGRVHINDEYWSQLIALVESTNSSLLFGLPLQLNSEGNYDPTINATALWATTAAKKYRVDGWSLGNELISPSFNTSRYVSDYKIFAAALKQYPSIGQQIYGPSAAGYPGEAPITTFITGTQALVTAFTFHAYAFENCSLDNYMIKTNVEHMMHYIGAYSSLRDSIAPNSPLILEECATQAGGGCEGLSDRFVSGFWWMHTLGMAAENKISRVQRQDIAGFSFNGRPSHYMLAGVAGWINSNVSGPLSPHPDWFTTVLHKQLAGRAVLSSSLNSSSSPYVGENVAVHVWCAAPNANAPSGSLTLSYINMNTNDTELVLPSSLSSFPRLEYILTPGPVDTEGIIAKIFQAADAPVTLTSDIILLNGEQLTVDKEGNLPSYPIQGKRVNDGSSVILPAWSYGFFVLESANAGACK